MHNTLAEIHRTCRLIATTDTERYKDVLKKAFELSVTDGIYNPHYWKTVLEIKDFTIYFSGNYYAIEIKEEVQPFFKIKKMLIYKCR